MATHRLDLELLRCPLSQEPLACGDGVVTSTGGRAYALKACGDETYVDFLSAVEPSSDPTRALQQRVYDTVESRYFRQGAADKARFMKRFIDRRLGGTVKAKDELIFRAMRGLSLERTALVLEIGCNDGRFLNVLSALYHCRGVGIDLSETAIRQALESRPQGLDTSFHVAEASPLPFRDGAFDVIVSFDVFEHLGHDGFRRTMKECARLLKPGGTLLAYVVSQKDRFTLHETLRRISHGRVGVDEGEGHVYENFIRPDLFRAVAAEVGLEVSFLEAYHGFWTLYAEEFLVNALPRLGYKWLEFLDAPLTSRDFGNGFLASARRG